MWNFRRVTPVRAASLAVIFVLIFAQASFPEEWASPAQKLAKKISEKLDGGQTIALSFQNLSSATTDQAGRASKSLEAELQAAGLRLRGKDEAAVPNGEASIAQVKTTLAENIRGFVWVAEIVNGETREVVMTGVPRAAPAPITTSVPAMLLRSQKILEQETPILDLALINSPGGAPARLLALEAARIAVYSSDQGRWQFREAKSLLALQHPQRDLRGILRINGDRLAVSLPEEMCDGSVRDTVTLQCESTSHPFDENGAGVSSALRRTPSSHSGATIEVNGKQVEVAMGLDGVARLYESSDAKDPAATFSGWGSELAGVKTGCGGGWQILTTRASDYTERDAVQAFEMAEKQALAVSPALDFAGPVIALHASENQDAGLAVVRNLLTGRYEAHKISVTCGR